MNKKGFIATSLIYSFFLVFCAILVSYVSLNTHNKNLLDKTNEEIRDDLKSKTLNSVDTASFVELNLKNELINVDNVEWLVFNNDDNYTYLISDRIVLSFDYTNEVNFDNVINSINELIQEFENDCLVNEARLLNKTELNDFLENEEISLREKILKVDDNNWYLINYENNTYKKIQFYDKTSYILIRDYSAGDKINVRLVISLPGILKIAGGNGTETNPYTISNVNCL
jgi:hypothetical protein